jgi:hypothetical protein
LIEATLSGLNLIPIAGAKKGNYPLTTISYQKTDYFDSKITGTVAKILRIFCVIE